MEKYFSIVVRTPYNLDGLLEMNDVDILRNNDSTVIKHLNSCFEDIEDDLKFELIGFIREFIITVKTDIYIQKKEIKKTEKNIIKLKKQGKDLKSNTMIDAENNLSKAEFFLFHYKARLNTLKNWVKEKSNNKTKTEKQHIPKSTKELIEKAFRFMQFDDLRKPTKILSDKDYNKLIKWVTYYFDNDHNLPLINTPIKEVNTPKGNIIHTFKKFYKNEYPRRVYPPSLFELYRTCFYQFRNDDIKNFNKQKEPQYYKELIDKYK